MNIVVNNEPRIRDIKVSSDSITAFLVDGRIVSVPLAWSWRLSEATPAQRAKWRIIGDGQGVHWPAVDEDISIRGMLYGVPAHRPSAKKPPVLRHRRNGKLESKPAGRARARDRATTRH